MSELAVTKQIEEIRQSAESMDAAKTEVVGTASVGDVVRQGDLYMICLKEVPDSTPSKDRQLAPGTSQGSRHVASGRCTIRLVSDRNALAQLINRLVKSANVPPELIGPVIHCKSATTITHPEHGHKVLPADSTWAVVYQRDHAEEVRRVQD